MTDATHAGIDDGDRQGPTGGSADHHASPEHDGNAAPGARVLVYSDDRVVRASVIRALGPRPVLDLGRFEYVECATEPAAIALVDTGTFDLLILDGEAAPAGGLGLARQVKDEIYRCPPVLVLIARPQDAWLATWCRADAVASTPVNPGALPGVVATLVRRRLGIRQSA